MNSTGIILIASIILGAALFGSGTYFIINNIVEPQGLLFEGIAMLSLGTIMILLVTVASALGKTMITFGDIISKQAEIQKKLNSINTTAPGTTPEGTGGFGSLISTLMKQNPDSFKVYPMTADDHRGIHLDESSYDDKMKQLKEKLSSAIKDDDFEQAKEINHEIKKLQKLMGDDSSDGGNDEKKDE